MMVIGESLRAGEVIERSQQRDDNDRPLNQLLSFKVNAIIESGTYHLPNARDNSGDWVLVMIDPLVNISGEGVTILDPTNNPITHRGNQFDDVRVQAKGREFRFTKRNGFWEAL